MSMRFNNWLESIGIDITLMFAGMIGSILMTTRRSFNSLKSTLIGIASGTLSANYLTQVVIEIFDLEGRSQYGVAFLLGYFGLKGVEKFIEKYHKQNVKTESKTKYRQGLQGEGEEE